MFGTPAFRTSYKKGDRMSAFVRRILRPRLLLITCVLVAALPPAVAYASTVTTYRQSVDEPGGQWHTSTYQVRDFNRVYHQSGYTWGTSYCFSSPISDCLTYYYSSANPTVDPYGSTSPYTAQAWCENLNDNSGVNWTCQTTTP